MTVSSLLIVFSLLSLAIFVTHESTKFKWVDHQSLFWLVRTTPYLVATICSDHFWIGKMDIFPGFTLIQLVYVYIFLGLNIIQTLVGGFNPSEKY